MSQLDSINSPAQLQEIGPAPRSLLTAHGRIILPGTLIMGEVAA